MTTDKSLPVRPRPGQWHKKIKSSEQSALASDEMFEEAIIALEQAYPSTEDWIDGSPLTEKELPRFIFEAGYSADDPARIDAFTAAIRHVCLNKELSIKLQTVWHLEITFRFTHTTTVTDVNQLTKEFIGQQLREDAQIQFTDDDGNETLIPKDAIESITFTPKQPADSAK